MEESLERITETWEIFYKEFEESGNESPAENKEFSLPFHMASPILMRRKSKFKHINHSHERELSWIPVFFSAPLNLTEDPVCMFLPFLWFMGDL